MRLRRLLCFCFGVVLIGVLLVAVRLLIAHQRVSSFTDNNGAITRALLTTPEPVQAPIDVKMSPTRAYARANPIDQVDITKYRDIPSPALPLHTIVGELKKMSDLGSARASCRLAQELNRCRYLPSLTARKLKLTESLLQLNPLSDDHKRLSRLIERTNVQERLDATICDDFHNSENLDSWTYMFRAAAAGYEPAMLNFATLPPLDFDTLLRQPEALVAYYQHSDQILDQLAARGNRIAVMSIVRKHLGSTFWSDIAGAIFAPTVNYALAATYAYAGLAHNWEQKFFEQKIALARSHLSPEQLASAQREAMQLVSSWDKTVFDEKRYESPVDRFAGCD